MINDNKTTPTDRDIIDFVAGLPENQQTDSQILIQMMQEISGEPPVLWGSRIVGFGKYHYRYESGKTVVTGASGSSVELTKIIVNGGSGDAEYPSPFSFPLKAPNNNGGQQADISHVIVCYGESEEETDIANASVTTTPATCELGEKLVYGNITNASFSGTANGTTGPGAYSVVATADEDAYFDGEKKTLTFEGTLDGKIPSQSTDPEGDCYLEPGKGSEGENPKTPETPKTPVTTSEVEIAELPNTAGSFARVASYVAVAIVGLLIASYAIKSRLLNS